MQLTATSLPLDPTSSLPSGSSGQAATDLASLLGASPTDGAFSALLGAECATSAAPTATPATPLTATANATATLAQTTQPGVGADPAGTVSPTAGLAVGTDATAPTVDMAGAAENTSLEQPTTTGTAKPEGRKPVGTADDLRAGSRGRSAKRMRAADEPAQEPATPAIVASVVPLNVAPTVAPTAMPGATESQGDETDLATETDGSIDGAGAMTVSAQGTGPVIQSVPSFASAEVTKATEGTGATPAQEEPAALPTRAGGMGRDAARLMKAYGSFAASTRSATAVPTAMADGDDDAATSGAGEPTTSPQEVPAATTPIAANAPLSSPIAATPAGLTNASAKVPVNLPTADDAPHDDLTQDNADEVTVTATSERGAPSGSSARANTSRNTGLGPVKISREIANETTTDSTLEKFAAATPAPTAQLDNVANVSIKKSLRAVGESVTKHVSSVGTGVAKSEDLVPVITANTSSAPTATLDPVSSVAPAVSFEALTKEATNPATTEHVSAAHQAVQTVLNATDQAASSGQRSVNLQFSVSGVDLSVRVQMRGDAVHTTFRTDSAELRSALAHEWQSVATDATASRPQRMADPVFAAHTTDGGTSAGTTADQRDSGARQQAPTADEFANARTMARFRAESAPATASAAATVTPTRSAPLQAPGRLNVFV